MTDPEREFAALRDAGIGAFAPPPADWFPATARRRSRRRVATAVAAALVAGAVIGGVALAAGPRPTGQEVATPSASAQPSRSTSPSPSPSPSASPSAPPSAASASPQPPALDIRRVDWRRATITLPRPPAGTDCPAGRLTMTGEWTVTGKVQIFMPTASLAVGDLTGDGQAEAVLDVGCAIDADIIGDGYGFLMVVTVRNNALVGLGYVGPEGYDYPAAKVVDGQLVVTVVRRYTNEGARQQRTYRWSGTTFVQVAGPTAYPSPAG
jgi:hypothetical protein